MILLAHLSWCNPTINGSINPKVDEQQFLQMHWALLNGYHNMEKRQVFHDENGIDDCLTIDKAALKYKAKYCPFSQLRIRI